MHRATVAVYFDDLGSMAYPFSNWRYFESYKDFTRRCKERGIRLVITRGKQAYLGSLKFASGWEFVGDELQDISGIQADLVYIKARRDGLPKLPGEAIINDPVFEEIAQNKWATYELFSKLMAPTFLVDQESLLEKAGQIATDKVVIKPVRGLGGDGVQIVEKAALAGFTLDASEPQLIQAFTDSSAGVPGISEGIHDLRVILFAGVPTLSFIRMPKPGSYLSNLAQGGSLKVVKIADLPRSAMELVQKVDAKFGDFPERTYTVDILFEDGAPCLCEINTRPGFPTTQGDDYADTFFNSLIGVFENFLITRP